MQCQSQNVLPDTNQVFTVNELATYLRLDRKAVYDAIHRGDIPGVRRIGKVYRISHIAVVAWLQDGAPVAAASNA